MCSSFDVGQPVRVIGKDGWKGIVHSWFGGSADSQGEREITIRIDTGEALVVPDSVLSGRPDGSYYVPLSLDEIRSAASGNAPTVVPAEEAGPPAVVIPVIHEELEVGKRTVETGGGVRIHKSAREEEHTVDLPLMREEVEVEHVPVGRVLDGPAPVRHLGDTIIVPVVEEVLVVQKQFRLVEELHIRKIRTETRDPRTVVLRKEKVSVERLEPAREDPEEKQGGTDDFRAV